VKIKNYTSTVPAERTIASIEKTLAEAGASGIVKDYAAGKVIALSFRISLPQRDIVIRLPSNHEAVYAAMRKQLQQPRSGTLERLREQSIRTSWKLMQDWVEVQLTLIRMQQVDFLQVFLPYVWDGKQTFYESIKHQNYLALPPNEPSNPH